MTVLPHCRQSKEMADSFPNLSHHSQGKRCL